MSVPNQEGLSRPRRYRSPLRAEQAQATRARVLAAAVRLFAESSYTAVTMDAIAEQAGVSRETVFGIGSKRALLLAAVDTATVGDDQPIPLADRDWPNRWLVLRDRQRILQAAASWLSAAHARSAALVQALAHAASQDEDLARAYAELLAGMRRDARRLAELMLGLGDVREGVDVDTLTDSLWVLCGPETYLRLTSDGGWSGDRYVAWLANTMGAVIYRHPTG